MELIILLDIKQPKIALINFDDKRYCLFLMQVCHGGILNMIKEMNFYQSNKK